MMKNTIAILAAMLMFIGTAQAAAPAANWSGYYVGGNLGFAHQQWGIPFYDSQTPANGEKVVTANDITGGITFGRNWQDGNRVYGFETDLNGSALHTDEDGGFDFDNCGCLDLTMDAYASVRGRYGMLFNANNGTLLYGTGGLIVGHMYYKPADSTPIYGSDGIFAPGVIVGFGAETHVLQDNITAKAEILYYDFGRPDFEPADVGFRTDMRVWGFTPRIGVNFHF